MSLSAGSVSLSVKPDTSDFGSLLRGNILKGITGVGGEIGSSILGGLKSMAGPIAGVLAGVGIAKFVDESVHKFEELAGGVKGLQRVIGGSVEDVSALRGAFQLAGVSTDNITTSLTRFSRNLASAGADSKNAAAFAKEFGTSVLDSNGHVKNLADILPDVANKFASMQNGTEKTALAVQLFGRSGTQLLPILNKGADGIAELTAKAKDMGLVIDDAAMEKFTESRKAQREWDATMQGLSVTVGSVMLPVVMGLKEAIQNYLIPAIEHVTSWVKQNHQVFDNIAGLITATVMPVVNTLGSIITNTIIPAFVGLVGWVKDNASWLSALAIGVGAAVIAWQGYKAVQTILAMVTIFQQAYTAALFGGTLATEEHLVAVKAAEIWYAIRNSTIVTSTGAWIANTAALVANTEGGLIAKAAVVAQSIATGVATAAQWAWNAALSANPIALVVIAIGALVAALVWFFTQTKLGQTIWQNFVSFIHTSMTALSSFFSTVWNGIQTAFTNVVDFMHTAFTNWGNGIIAIINTVIDGANSALSLIKNITGGAIDIKVSKVPKLAEGGIVPATPGGRIVRVAEAGQAEAIIPLDKMPMAGNGNKATTINYYAAPNDSISAERKLIDAVQRAKVLGAIV